MRLAAVAAPALAGAVAVGVLAGCGSAVPAGGATTTRSGTSETPAAMSAPSAAGAVETVAVPAGRTVIAQTGSTPAATALAAADLAKHPGARLYPDAPSRTMELSIANAGSVGDVEYIDAYTVASVCGGGIPDDCVGDVGAPEYRIRLAPDARFVLLGSDMRADRPADFKAFRQYAAGPDGKYGMGDFDYFVVTFDASGQATSLTAVYTP